MLKPVAPFVLLALLLPCSARADDGLDATDLKLGLRGGLNATLMLEPSDAEDYEAVPYTYYSGLGGFGGLALNWRFVQFLALEAGAYGSRERLDGTIDLEGVVVDGRAQQVEQQFQSWSLHVPVLLQVQFPIGPVRPTLGVGADFVVWRTEREYRVVAVDPIPADPAHPDYGTWHGDPEFRAVRDAGLSQDVPETYVGIVAAAGVIISAGRVEIPIELRASFYPPAGSDLASRVRLPNSTAPVFDPDDPISLSYDDIWTQQLQLLVGLDYLLF